LDAFRDVKDNLKEEKYSFQVLPSAPWTLFSVVLAAHVLLMI
jgi:hypothetical protein